MNGFGFSKSLLDRSAGRDGLGATNAAAAWRSTQRRICRCELAVLEFEPVLPPRPQRCKRRAPPLALTPDELQCPRPSPTIPAMSQPPPASAWLSHRPSANIGRRRRAPIELRASNAPRHRVPDESGFEKRSRLLHGETARSRTSALHTLHTAVHSMRLLLGLLAVTACRGDDDDAAKRAANFAAACAAAIFTRSSICRRRNTCTCGFLYGHRLRETRRAVRAATPGSEPANSRCARRYVGPLRRGAAEHVYDRDVRERNEGHRWLRRDPDVHIGLDIGGPAGTPVYAPAQGVIQSFGYNPDEAGDYGHVIVTEHVIEGVRCWMLFDTLDAASVAFKRVGQGWSAASA